MPPQWAVRSTLLARTYVPRTVPCVLCCAGLSCGGPPGGLIVLGSDPILRRRPFHLARRGSPSSLTHSPPSLVVVVAGGPGAYLSKGLENLKKVLILQRDSGRVASTQ